VSMLAALCIGLKRPTKVVVVSVLAALSIRLKRPALVVIILALAALPKGLKRPALVEMLLVDPLRREVRPGPGVSVWAALQLGVVSPTYKAASESRPVALRGSSSEAAPAGEQNPRTSWPSVQQAQAGGSPSSEGGGRVLGKGATWGQGELTQAG
jgi:hypothetical protein